MRSAIMAVGAALSLITMTNAGSAAPVVPALSVEQDSVIVQVRAAAVEGCTRIGGDGACRTDTDITALTHNPYYGGRSYQPWNRPSPGDYGAADALNRQQLGRPWDY